MGTTDIATFQLPPYLRERRARAWFDTVFTPYIRGLEQEQYLLSIRNWTYRSYKNGLERIGKAERWVDYLYLDNLTDVRQSLPDFKACEESHDKLPNLLSNLCVQLDGEIKNNINFIATIDTLYINLRKNLIPEEGDPLLIQDDFYETPQKIAIAISEYFVNNIKSLPDNNVVVYFYNKSYDQLENILKEDTNISRLRNDIQNCTDSIMKNISIF